MPSLPPAATTMPATNSSESPGRTGNSTPDSMKTTRSSPQNAQAPNQLSTLMGSRMPGRATTVVVWASAVSITGHQATWRSCPRANEWLSEAAVPGVQCRMWRSPIEGALHRGVHYVRYAAVSYAGAVSYARSAASTFSSTTGWRERRQRLTTSEMIGSTEMKTISRKITSTLSRMNAIWPRK